MDQHPIPQNVTGFQFKLIGKMTVKQFGYVALGVIAAFITYYLPIGGIIGVLVKIIFVPFFGASGAIIAFIPIDGRPIDTMAGNFLKAFLSPNQYVYRKTGVQFSFSKIQIPQRSVIPAKQKISSEPDKQASDKALQLQRLLSQSYANKPKSELDTKEAVFLKSLPQTEPQSYVSQSSSYPSPNTSASPVAVQKNQPGAPVPASKEDRSQVLEAKEDALKKQLASAKNEEISGQTQHESSMLHQKTIALEKELLETHSQKLALEQEIATLKKQLLAQNTPAPISTQIAKQQPQQQIKSVENNVSKAHVRSIPRDMNKKMGLLISDTPNVVSGVVKDPRGNILPNILVEIKDKENNPVRAFKTNALGNFASATPLSPGEYVITLEDPKKQQAFDEINIALTNQIFSPLEIISYDKREQLRRELFN